MELNTKEIFSTLGDNLVANIRDKIKSSGASATGKSAASLRHTETDTRFTLYGNNSFSFMEVGRGPGGMPPIDNIKEWIKAKGIAIGEGQTLSGLAYGIAKKISQQGTQLYANKTFRDIYTEESAKFIIELKKAIGESVRIKTSNEITRTIKLK
jgi:hypothetical protein